jgi:hypothetical protein
MARTRGGPARRRCTRSGSSSERSKFYHFRLWYRERFGPLLREVLLSPAALGRTALRPAELRAQVEEHLAGRANHTLQSQRRAHHGAHPPRAALAAGGDVVSELQNALAPAHIDVCICTHRRPHRLRAAAARAADAQRSDGRFVHAVIVVDNDPEASRRARGARLAPRARAWPSVTRTSPSPTSPAPATGRCRWRAARWWR